MADTTQPKVLICVPSIDRPHPESQQCLENLDRSAVESQILRTRRVIIDRARNAFAKAAIDRGADYLLFVDDDMVFDPWALNSLLARDVDVVAGLFFHRTVPPKPLLFHFDPPKDGEEYGRYRNFEPDEIFAAEEKGELLEVDATGTGFTLINASVLKALQEDDPNIPWFQTVDRGEAGFMSEDIFFCTRARDLGFKVFCDTAVKVGHIGDYTYGWHDFAMFKPTYDRVRKEGALTIPAPPMNGEAAYLHLT